MSKETPSCGARFIASLPPRFIVIAIVTISTSFAEYEAAAFERGIHGEISNEVLKEKNFSQDGINPIVTATEAADDYPPDGDWYVPQAHFDDEVFALGSQRLKEKFETVVRSLAASPPKVEVATRETGRILHAIQDFFSHSNFIVIQPGTTIDLFALSDPSPDSRKASVNCTSGQGPLSTGYYYYTDEDYQQGLATRIMRPANRCMHDDLNKDSSGSRGHQAARDAALLHSIRFIDKLKDRLDKGYPGRNLFELLRNPKPCQSEYAEHPELAKSGRQLPRPGINWGNGKAYIFHGNQYVRYDLASHQADAGYPQTIDAKSWPGLWIDGIDAAVNWGNGKAYFFKGGEYIRYDISSGKPDAGYPQKIDAKSWPGLWTSGVDAAVEWEGNKVYFFKGQEYLRYDTQSGQPDAGFPKPLSAKTWPGLCSNGIDGAVNWGNGKAYLFKGNWYFRYDVTRDGIDLGYPSAVNNSTWPSLPTTATATKPTTMMTKTKTMTKTTTAVSQAPRPLSSAVGSRGCRPERRIP